MYMLIIPVVLLILSVLVVLGLERHSNFQLKQVSGTTDEGMAESITQAALSRIGNVKSTPAPSVSSKTLKYLDDVITFLEDMSASNESAKTHLNALEFLKMSLVPRIDTDSAMNAMSEEYGLIKPTPGDEIDE